MEEYRFVIITALISSVLCPLLCAFIFWVCKNYWDKHEISNEGVKGLRLGVQALLRDRILQGCRYANEQGFSTHNARINITKMHEAYEKLGGNSVETSEYKMFMELPHKAEDPTYN